MTDYTKKYRNQFVSVAYLLMAISLILSVSCASQTTYVKYSPVANEGIHNKELGHNVSIAILDFPDRRLDSEGKKNMIGTIYGSFKNPLKRIYSHQTINLDVMDALENLFTANGFVVKTYPGALDYSNLSDEKLAAKGHINQFWTESYFTEGAVVDIYVEIFERKRERFIWRGKINGFEKRPGGGGVLTSPNDMVLFLNEVFSDAIEKTWTEEGMRKALTSLEKE